LPPHLRHIILNKPTPTIDPQALPCPQYVSLNHLYCTAIKDGMMVFNNNKNPLIILKNFFFFFFLYFLFENNIYTIFLIFFFNFKNFFFFFFLNIYIYYKVLGGTQRYREKFFTVVFYSVMPTSGAQY
jgi:hypothetical protein